MNKINSSRSSKKTDRRLNSSLVDTFVRYHDDPDNYRSNTVGFDELYDRLRTYARPGEVAEDMNVDELFVRATPQEQEEMVRLITPNRFNSSRRVLNCTALDNNYIPETDCYIVISNDGVQDNYDVFDFKEDVEDFLYDLIDSTYEKSTYVTEYEDRVQSIIDDVFRGTHPDYKVVIGYKH